MDQNLKNFFDHSYVIAGCSCAGKSTIGKLIAEKYSMRLYSVDDHERQHFERHSPEEHPTISRLLSLTPDELWGRPVPMQVEEALSFMTEQFEILASDLVEFRDDAPTIVEGSTMLPDLMARHAEDAQRVIYLVATREFQIQQFSKRKDLIEMVVGQCRNPEAAFKNWMARDHELSRRIARMAESHGYRVVMVDGSESIENNLRLATEHFGLQQASGDIGGVS